MTRPPPTNSLGQSPKKHFSTGTLYPKICNILSTSNVLFLFKTIEKGSFPVLARLGAGNILRFLYRSYFVKYKVCIRSMASQLMLQKVCKNSVALTRLAKISQLCLMKRKQVLACCQPASPQLMNWASIGNNSNRAFFAFSCSHQNGLLLQINAELCIWPFALFMMTHHIARKEQITPTNSDRFSFYVQHKWFSALKTCPLQITAFCHRLAKKTYIWLPILQGCQFFSSSVIRL